MQQSIFGAFGSWVGEHWAFAGGMGVLAVVLAGAVIFMVGRGRGKG